MKAAVFYEPGKVVVEERECRKPGPGEVLIQVKAAGVCGTDIHIFDGAKGASECFPPVVLGHEFAGVVAEIGEGVNRCAVGDHVTVDPSILCGKCYECQIGTPHFCQGYSATGVTYDGAFAEYCVVNEKQVFQLKKEISFEDGAMCEPLGCALHGIDQAQIKTGDVVVIIGGGTIGAIMLQLAKMAGAATLILSEPDASKRERAMKLGADITFNPLEEDYFEVLKKNNVRKTNVVIECVGSRPTMVDAVRFAGQGTRVVFFGLTDPDCEIPIKPFEIFQKEITITSSFVNPFTHGRAADIVNTGKLVLSDLISERLSLDEIHDAFKIRGKNGKMMVLPDK